MGGHKAEGKGYTRGTGKEVLNLSNHFDTVSLPRILKLVSNRKHGSPQLSTPLGFIPEKSALNHHLQSNHSTEALSKAVSH